MPIKTSGFGTTRSGREVKQFTLSNKNSCRCSLISYGATVRELIVPDRQGNLSDIVLGFDDLSGYDSPQNPYFGATVGRHANRIEDASFTLEGKQYRLARNNGRNHLHGGPGGFSRVVFEGSIVPESEEPAVRFSYFSPDGEEGYPGNLTTKVTFTLTSGNALRIDYHAVADKPTVLNLTNHSYFNLAGHDRGSILNHVMQIDADVFTPGNEELLPDGTLAEVANTPFDFRQPKPLTRDIDTDNEQLRFGGGYDHNFVLRPPVGELRKCAEIYEPGSGRVMTVATTLPGLQLYSGNMMQPVTGKDGAVYDRRHGFCLETQFFPNSLRNPWFPSPVFSTGQPFEHTTVYRFSTR